MFYERYRWFLFGNFGLERHKIVVDERSRSISSLRGDVGSSMALNNALRCDLCNRDKFELFLYRRSRKTSVFVNRGLDGTKLSSFLVY